MNLNYIDGFLLKSGSPSCGYKNVKIYNGTSKVTGSTKGAGLFGSKVKKIFPYSPVEDEGRLHNYRIRDNFLTRIFMNADFRKVKESNSPLPRRLNYVGGFRKNRSLDPIDTPNQNISKIRNKGHAFMECCIREFSCRHFFSRSSQLNHQ